jgi:hypothetical protein
MIFVMSHWSLQEISHVGQTHVHQTGSWVNGGHVVRLVGQGATKFGKCTVSRL